MKRVVAACLFIGVAFPLTLRGEDVPRPRWVAPARASQRRNPVACAAESVKAGEKIFRNNCASCHGATGKGDGLLAASLPVKPANLNSADIWHQSDGAVFWKVSTGRQPMPTWGPILEEEDRWNVINFLRTTYAPTTVLAANAVARADIANDPPAPAVDPPAPATEPAKPAPLTRDDYDALVRKLLQEQKQMRSEIEELKRQRAPSTESGTSATPRQPGGATGGGLASVEDLDDVARQVAEIRKDLDRTRPGSEGFLIVGDAFVGYSSLHGNHSTFSAGLSPLILWKPTQNLVIESSFDLNVDTNPDTSSSTSIDLTIADAAVFVTDWLTVGGGIFVTPFGV